VWLDATELLNGTSDRVFGLHCPLTIADADLAASLTAACEAEEEDASEDLSDIGCVEVARWTGCDGAGELMGKGDAVGAGVVSADCACAVGSATVFVFFFAGVPTSRSFPVPSASAGRFVVVLAGAGRVSTGSLDVVSGCCD
jgi:hypothetical protein